MELWIRSQDKEDLVKADNIRIKHEYNQKEVKDNYGRVSAYIKGNYMKSMIYSNNIWLGEYNTKERALEVLDEIQNILKQKTIYTQKEPIEIHKLGAYQIKQILDMETQEMNTFVYEMPEE